MSEDHWTETLFLRHPEVFLAVHENAWSTGEAQAKDLQRILRRRDGRPDPARVRETRPARRNPDRLPREPGLRRPPLRPTGLRIVRGYRAHRTAALGPRDLSHAERVAVLPAERRGLGPHLHHRHRTLHLQPA